MVLLNKTLSHITKLLLASSIVLIFGLIADIVCLGTLLAWISGMSSFRSFGIALCIDAILFCTYGLISEALKQDRYKLNQIVAELEKKRDIVK